MNSQIDSFFCNLGFPNQSSRRGLWEWVGCLEMAYLEFPLAQGWAKGITINFGGIEDTKTFFANHDRTKAIFLKQVHGASIVNVDSLTVAPSEPLGPADGAWAQGDILRESGLKIVIRTADCLPLFYIDHKNHFLAGVHAGWRGLVHKIHLVPFTKLGFDPKTTWVWVGPSLAKSDFAVKADMWTQFDPATQKDEKIFSSVPVEPGDVESRLFDPWALIARDFGALQTELIYNVEVNTYRDKALASYRRSCHLHEPIPLPYQNYSWIEFKS